MQTIVQLPTNDQKKPKHIKRCG
ncbi:BnaA04g10400D [Brassica napus]|uniref:BnaA04g10400D protein n=1 Tax=Brassica napus TaxID=3708 RepID=A0A078I0J4_BRANA|nr:BnaA04g10400D [Brassica napus]